MFYQKCMFYKKTYSLFADTIFSTRVREGYNVLINTQIFARRSCSRRPGLLIMLAFSNTSKDLCVNQYIISFSNTSRKNSIGKQRIGFFVKHIFFVKHKFFYKTYIFCETYNFL